MQSGGGVIEVCVCVCVCVDERGILWDACPLISLCVCARAGCVVVCEGEKEERRQRRAHTLPQNT